MALEIELYDSHIIWQHNNFDKSYVFYDSNFKIININNGTYEALESDNCRDVYQYMIENIVYDDQITFKYLYNLPQEKIDKINKIANEWEDDNRGILSFILLLL